MGKMRNYYVVGLPPHGVRYMNDFTEAMEYANEIEGSVYVNVSDELIYAAWLRLDKKEVTP